MGALFPLASRPGGPGPDRLRAGRPSHPQQLHHPRPSPSETPGTIPTPLWLIRRDLASTPSMTFTANDGEVR